MVHILLLTFPFLTFIFAQFSSYPYILQILLHRRNKAVVGATATQTDEICLTLNRIVTYDYSHSAKNLDSFADGLRIFRSSRMGIVGVSLGE